MEKNKCAECLLRNYNVCKHNDKRLSKREKCDLYTPQTDKRKDLTATELLTYGIK